MIGRPVGGRAGATDEASDAQWFDPASLRTLDIHLTMRRQIDNYLQGRFPHVD